MGNSKNLIYGILASFFIVILASAFLRMAFYANAQVEIPAEEIKFDFSDNPLYPLPFDSKAPLDVRSADSVILEKAQNFGVDMLSLTESKIYEATIDDKIKRLNDLVSKYSMLYDSCKNK